MHGKVARREPLQRVIAHLGSQKRHASSGGEREERENTAAIWARDLGQRILRGGSLQRRVMLNQQLPKPADINNQQSNVVGITQSFRERLADFVRASIGSSGNECEYNTVMYGQSKSISLHCRPSLSIQSISQFRSDPQILGDIQSESFSLRHLTAFTLD